MDLLCCEFTKGGLFFIHLTGALRLEEGSVQ